MIDKPETSKASVSEGQLAFTGERFVPEVKGQLAYEHFHRYALAARYVSGRVVLDVASGEGYGSALLARYARSVVGVDVSQEAVNHAQRKYASLTNVSFLQGRCEELPFAESTFDVVVSFETIEHIAEQRRFLQEVRRVLKPDGLLILSSPNRAAYRKDSAQNPFHVHEVDRAELESLLRGVFPSIRLLGQRLTFSSYVWPLDSSERAGFCHYTDGNVTQSPQPPFEAEYFLALCTADDSVELPGVSLFTSCADDLLREYHDRGRWGQSLEAELQEKEQLLHALRQEITLLRRQTPKMSSTPERAVPEDCGCSDSLIEEGESVEEAVERLTRYVLEHPEDARAYNDLGVLHDMLGDVESAVAYFHKAVALASRFLVAKKNLADALIQQGNFEEATRLYQGIVGEHPDDVAALTSLGSLLLLANRASAKYYLRRAVELDPTNTTARALLDRFPEREIVAHENPNGGSDLRCVSCNYETKRQSEIHRYAADLHVHDLPAIHHVVNEASLSQWLKELTGESDIRDWWAKEISEMLKSRAGNVRVLSIGCGNGDVELDVLARVYEPERVQLLGLDLNPTMIERANALAAQRGFPQAVFSVQDLNNVKLSGQFDVVLASHSLHHIVELEKLFAAIDAAASEQFIFLVNDMIGRNGHVMWSATYSVVRTIWDTLDRKYKYNAYWKTYDDEPMNHDCSREGFEGIRAQDILPLLIQRFDCEMFLPFATIINRFTDRGYGHNFHPDDPEDRDLIMRILALDLALLKEKKLAPVQCLMKLRTKGAVRHLRYLFQTPEEVIQLRSREIGREEFVWGAPDTRRVETPSLVTS